VDAANAVRDTACHVSRNGNDSTRVPPTAGLRAQNQAAAFGGGGKVLNLCIDSKFRSTVIFPAVARKFFTNCLRWREAAMHFRTTDHRYADK
jgi:hypothetical protein